eukprot:jgi/Bigna1/129470/aug1.9_g4178
MDSEDALIPKTIELIHEKHQISDTARRSLHDDVEQNVHSELKFDWEEEDHATPYHMQGDEKFQKSHFMEARRMLEHNTYVQNSINRFWVLYAEDEDDEFYQSVVRWDKYFAVYQKIAKVVGAGNYEDDDIKTCALQDWERDLAWSPDGTSSEPDEADIEDRFLSHEQWVHSIFEVADQWTYNVQPQDLLHPSPQVIDGKTVARDIADVETDMEYSKNLQNIEIENVDSSRRNSLDSDSKEGKGEGSESQEGTEGDKGNDGLADEGKGNDDDDKGEGAKKGRRVFKGKYSWLNEVPDEFAHLLENLDPKNIKDLIEVIREIIVLKFDVVLNAWKVIDVNRDRKIDMEEFGVFLKKIGFSFVPMQIQRKLWRIADHNMDQVMSFQEFRIAFSKKKDRRYAYSAREKAELKRKKQSIIQAKKARDSLRLKIITSPEQLAEMKDDEKVEAVRESLLLKWKSLKSAWNVMDKNHDKEISREEFGAGLSKTGFQWSDYSCSTAMVCRTKIIEVEDWIVDELWNLADNDGSKSLDFKEFTQTFRRGVCVEFETSSDEEGEEMENSIADTDEMHSEILSQSATSSAISSARSDWKHHGSHSKTSHHHHDHGHHHHYHLALHKVPDSSRSRASYTSTSRSSMIRENESARHPHHHHFKDESETATTSASAATVVPASSLVDELSMTVEADEVMTHSERRRQLRQRKSVVRLRAIILAQQKGESNGDGGSGEGGGGASDEESTKFLQSLSSSFDVPLLSSKGGVEAIRYRIIQCAKDGTGFLLNAADEFNVDTLTALGGPQIADILIMCGEEFSESQYKVKRAFLPEELQEQSEDDDNKFSNPASSWYQRSNNRKGPTKVVKVSEGEEALDTIVKHVRALNLASRKENLRLRREIDQKLIQEDGTGGSSEPRVRILERPNHGRKRRLMLKKRNSRRRVKGRGRALRPNVKGGYSGIDKWVHLSSVTPEKRTSSVAKYHPVLEPIAQQTSPPHLQQQQQQQQQQLRPGTRIANKPARAPLVQSLKERPFAQPASAQQKHPTGVTDTFHHSLSGIQILSSSKDPSSNNVDNETLQQLPFDERGEKLLKIMRKEQEIQQRLQTVKLKRYIEIRNRNEERRSRTARAALSRARELHEEQQQRQINFAKRETMIEHAKAQRLSKSSKQTMTISSSRPKVIEGASAPVLAQRIQMGSRIIEGAAGGDAALITGVQKTPITTTRNDFPKLTIPTGETITAASPKTFSSSRTRLTSQYQQKRPLVNIDTGRSVISNSALSIALMESTGEAAHSRVMMKREKPQRYFSRMSSPTNVSSGRSNKRPSVFYFGPQTDSTGRSSVEAEALEGVGRGGAVEAGPLSDLLSPASKGTTSRVTKFVPPEGLYTPSIQWSQTTQRQQRRYAMDEKPREFVVGTSPLKAQEQRQSARVERRGFSSKHNKPLKAKATSKKQQQNKRTMKASSRPSSSGVCSTLSRNMESPIETRERRRPDTVQHPEFVYEPGEGLLPTYVENEAHRPWSTPNLSQDDSSHREQILSYAKVAAAIGTAAGLPSQAASRALSVSSESRPLTRDSSRPHSRHSWSINYRSGPTLGAFSGTSTVSKGPLLSAKSLLRSADEEESQPPPGKTLVLHPVKRKKKKKSILAKSTLNGRMRRVFKVEDDPYEKTMSIVEKLSKISSAPSRRMAKRYVDKTNYPFIVSPTKISSAQQFCRKKPKKKTRGRWGWYPE